MVGKSNMIRGKSDCKVLFGRSKEAYHNPGNIKFRQTISLSAPDYLSAGNRRNRSKVVMSVWEYLLVELKAEFYKLGNKRQWIRVSDREAKDKVSHALRDAARFEQKGSGSQGQKHRRPLANMPTPPLRSSSETPPTTPTPLKLPKTLSSQEISEKQENQQVKLGMEAVGEKNKPEEQQGLKIRTVSSTSLTESEDDCCHPKPKSQMSTTSTSPREVQLPGTSEKSDRTMNDTSEHQQDERYANQTNNAFDLMALEPIPVQEEEHLDQSSTDDSNYIYCSSSSDDGDFDDWTELDQVLDGWDEMTRDQAPPQLVTPITPEAATLTKMTRSVSEVHFFGATSEDQSSPDSHFVGSIEPAPLQSILDYRFQVEGVETSRTKFRGRRSAKKETKPHPVQWMIEPLPI